ncbi:prephenate dehydratase [Gluconobacter wancherniae]|uniref:prephenate dehydratase n=1 Tax=Gluconobacter wancherniae NBRC 103581 TaxID=656744 RepID=A0A511AZ27_9PROT|nr:prephenate dehydratase [Gluconobacter wancherniae]MBF0853622.1 prephenate dehydratase [Gluconobacter wancherniae]MBS1088999.1 prephenate dehydratase [Gluconobacter wancherniae]GBD55632.1 prephenate dehydratase [Gluconobacter wancherniae NBRC 103581]GBR66397.1 prephenate dehydratase [Gluconobacter wancherniae NBRC 103581]GEK93465.1 prephenate dehydratase [Gluconobacter wancherniae NBRC 103581]
MPIIAFQGRPGAYSDLLCRMVKPGWTTLPCRTFAEAIEAVHVGSADEAMLACENTLAGRVPDIHSLLPDADLYIVGEHFQRVEHCLLAVKGTRISDIRRIHTHPVALGQIRSLISELGAEAVPEFDTAGAAELVAKWNNPEDAAIASSLAGELNGLDLLRCNVEDATHNTTRFYRVAKEPCRPDPSRHDTLTTLLMRVRNRSGALYAALGGFSRHGINMTRIESYMLNGSFTATQFLMDVEGHPEQPALSMALSELGEVSDNLRILGVYPRSLSRDGA